MIDRETSHEGMPEAAGASRPPAGVPVERRRSERRAADRVRSPSVPGSDPETSAPTRPIGDYLRRQRVLRGITIEELSELTRIPLRSLERLERGQFDGEADGFVRGFVRTVALALGLDADDAVARMLQEPGAGVWERHAPGRRARQLLALGGLLVAVVLTGFVLRAGWGVLVGDHGAEGARDVVVWRDPVRALADAAGVEVDPAGEIRPGRPISPSARREPARPSPRDPGPESSAPAALR